VTEPAPPTAPDPPRKRGFLRTNVEAFAVAIAMALVIKTFAVEAFQVPTESMEPAIIGRTPGGNHLLVDKGAYYVRDPERYEIVVFRYDLSRPVNYVKRCIGLPGETVLIAHGDIYAGPAGGPLRITRKPEAVQTAIFDTNPVIPSSHEKDFDFGRLNDYWSLPRTGTEVRGGVLHLDGGPDARLVSLRSEQARRSPAEVQQMSERERSLYRLRESGITPYRRDPMAETRGGRMDAFLEVPVGDVRFGLDVTPGEGCAGILVHITDGTRVQSPLRLQIGVEAAGRATSSTFRDGTQDAGDGQLQGVRIRAGRRSRIVVEHADDRYRLLIDGDEAWRYEYDQPPEGNAVGRSTVAFGVAGGTAAFHRLDLARDLYYTEYAGAPTRFVVPPGHYLFLGDNSANSLDARGFRVVGIRLHEDGRVLLGDMEAVSDDLLAPRRGTNPYFEVRDGTPDEGVHHFIDIQGNRWRLEPGSYDILDLSRIEDPTGVAVMELHQQRMPSPDPAIIAHAAVDSARLRIVAPPSPPDRPSPHHELVPISRFAHFTPRRNVVGRAFFTFWPPSRWGCVR
jgi:signal peptidase I